MKQDPLNPSSDVFSQRKKDHIDISLRDDSQAFVDQFSQIELQHNAVPEVNLSDVSLKTEVFGHSLKSPLFVSSMTLGHEGAEKLNEPIMRQCQEQGWMMGLGSQRRQLFDPKAYQECEKLRSQFPSVVLFGNIGLSQVIETSVEKIRSLVESLDAQFLVVHTNPMQEAIQAEGTPNFKGSLEALSTLCAQVGVPVVLKETGCGFSRKTMEQVSILGLSAVDVSGMGGTHWGRVEGLRQKSSDLGYQVAQTFSQWGISTVDSVKNGLDLERPLSLWASGGVRNGLDAAKLLVIGAEKIGFARPILQAVTQSEDDLKKLLNRLDYELKVAMFCLGVTELKSLVGNRELCKWK